MEVKPGYKPTEVGVLPEEWDVGPLGDCLKARPSYGINAPAVPYSDLLPVYVRITDITEDGRLTPTQRVSVRSKMSDSYFLADGDIVFARTGASVGKSYRYNPDDGPLVYAGFLIRISPNPEKLLPAFAAAYATTGAYWRWVCLMSMRSGQPGINGNEYAQMPIPLPSLPEQHAIATALSDVDALLGGLARLIGKKRDLKQAAMQQLLTGETRLPGFDDEWEVKRLGEVFAISTGTTKSAFVTDGGDYWICDMGSVSSTGRLIVSKRTNYRDDFLNRGDLVMPKDDIGGGKIIGKVGYVDANHTYVLGDHVYCLRAREGDPRFLAYTINSHQTNSALRRKVIGSAQLGLGRRSVEEQEIPWPVPTEQSAIAEVLSDMDAEVAALEARRIKTRDLKQAMMQELLTGKTRLVTPEVAHA